MTGGRLHAQLQQVGAYQVKSLQALCYERRAGWLGPAQPHLVLAAFMQTSDHKQKCLLVFKQGRDPLL